MTQRDLFAEESLKGTFPHLVTFVVQVRSSVKWYKKTLYRCIVCHIYVIQTEQTFANATNENSGVTPTFSLEEHAVEAIVRNILPMTIEFVRLTVTGIRWGNLPPRGELAYNKSTTKYWVTLQISEMEWKFWNKCWHNCCFITHGFRISSRKLGTDVRQLLWRILSQLAHFYKKLRDIVEHSNFCSDEK